MSWFSRALHSLGTGNLGVDTLFQGTQRGGSSGEWGGAATLDPRILEFFKKFNLTPSQNPSDIHFLNDQQGRYERMLRINPLEEIGRQGAESLVAGAFPELGQDLVRQGQLHIPATPLTFNKQFGTRLLAQSQDQGARAGMAARDQAMRQLSASGLLSSGQRLGFERDFASAQGAQRIQQIQSLLMQKAQMDRAEKLDAMAQALSVNGAIGQAQLLRDQSRQIRDNLKTESLARSLIPLQMLLQGAETAFQIPGLMPRGGNAGPVPSQATAGTRMFDPSGAGMFEF